MKRTIVTAALMAFALACGPASVLLVPGNTAKDARGEVKASLVGDRARVDIDARKLPAPGKVAAGTSVYVVWVRGLKAEDEAVNLGILRPDQDGNAKLQAFTELHDFSLFVTPETSALAAKPNGEAVVSTQVHVK